MIGLDLDNNKLYLGQNGVWENSANPAAGTGGLSITAPSDTYTGFYHFAAGDYDNGSGHLIYNGEKVGNINYETGAFNFQISSLPIASFEIHV